MMNFVAVQDIAMKTMYFNTEMLLEITCFA